MSVPAGRLTFKCKMLDGSDGQFEIEDCGENPRCYHGRPGEEQGKPFKGWMTWIKVGDIEDYSVVESADMREAEDLALLRHHGVNTDTVDWIPL